MRPQRWQPTRLPCPWDTPGKNTGVGCHFLLHCMKVKSESEVAQSCPTLRDPMDWGQAPLSMGFSRQEYWSGLPLPSPEMVLRLYYNFRALKNITKKEPLWRTVWRFIKNLKVDLLYDQAIPLLGIYPEKTIIWKDTCTSNVHWSSIHNSQDMEAT